MIIVRDVLIAKPGQASKLAQRMKEVWGSRGVKVMTDMTGVFNKVVMESELQDLASWEKMMQDYRNDSEINKGMTGYTEMYQSGKREIYQVVE